jgi:hypothetical protein
LVEAEFKRDVATATKPKRKLTPRAAWEEALREADELAAGVINVEDPDEARELVAESLVSLGRGSPALVQALMDPRRSPPALTLEDAREVYVKERLGGGESAEHRPAMVRLERVMRLAAEAGLPASTPLVSVTREHARKVRDHMASRSRQGSEGERVSPASVKRELGLLRTMISYGARELGLLDLFNPFEKLPIEGATAATGARVSAREKVDPLPPKVAAAMRTKLGGDLLLIWRLLEGTGCRLGEVTGLDKAAQDVVLGHAAPNVGETYGGEEGLLAVALRALRAVEAFEAGGAS